MGYGFSGYFGLKRESTWGSGAAATSFVEILNENVTLSKDRFDYKNVINTMSAPDDVAGVNRIAGSVSFACNASNIGFFLASAMNRVTTTSIAAALWKHIFQQPATSNSAFSAEAPSVPYTLEIFRDVTTATQYTGGLVTDLSFNFAPKQDVRCSAGFICRGTSQVSAQAATFPNSPTTPFTFDQVSISLGGSATAKIENLTVKIGNGYDGIPALNGSKDISKVRRTSFQEVMIDGTIDFSDNVEYTNFINQTEQQLIVTATQGASFQMVLNMPRIVYTSYPLGIAGRDRNLVSFAAKAFYHTGSGTGLAVTLTTINSYH